MAKESKKFKGTFIILEILLLIILIALIFIYFEFDKKFKTKQTNYNNLVTTYENKEKELENKKEELKKINEEIEGFVDIDKKIEDVKNTYFKTIKDLEDDILSGKSNKKIAYLTFDDGPYLNTYKVLEILDKYDAKATFFTTTVNDKYYYEQTGTYNWDLYKEYLKYGHTIANHTYTHAIFKGLYNSTDSFIDAVKKQHEQIITQTGGYIPNILRFPGGSGTAGSLKYPIISELKKLGYGWVDWSAHDGDGGNLRNEAQAWDTLYKTIDSNIEVILLHDYAKITTDILPEMIEYLQGKGYILLPLFYESNMINK